MEHDLMKQGAALQREGKLAAARNCYAKALRLDPTLREAQAAMEMVDDILTFEHKDNLNV